MSYFHQISLGEEKALLYGPPAMRKLCPLSTIIALSLASPFAYAEKAKPKSAASKGSKKVAGASKTANNLPEEMVKVPAGEFHMGCNSVVDTKCFKSEKPGHKKHLPAFFIDKTEVTVDAYRACVRAGACTDHRLTVFEKKHKEFVEDKFCNWGYKDRGNHPINCVDWMQALTFCEWKGKRLPTGAEWEKAARGTDGRKYPWGNEKATCKHAVLLDGEVLLESKKGCGRSSTWPVGSKPAGASPYGALDMAGNVSEWTSGWSSQESKYRPERGGCWINPGRYLRASHREARRPGYRGDGLGFRCAKSL